MKTIDEFRATFHYDPSTGNIFWKVSRGAVKAGTLITNKWNTGYCRIRFDGKEYLAHRVAWLLYYGRWPEAQIDHINRNPSDNRICNLRAATISENACNRVRPRQGLKGVSFMRSTGKFRARIRKNGWNKHLGIFLTEEEAHAAYCEAAPRVHGKFASLE